MGLIGFIIIIVGLFSGEPLLIIIGLLLLILKKLVS